MKRISRARKYRRRRRILYTFLLLIIAGVVALVLNFDKIQDEYDWLTLKPEQKLKCSLRKSITGLAKWM